MSFDQNDLDQLEAFKTVVTESVESLHFKLSIVEHRLIEVKRVILNWLELKIGPDTKRLS